PEVWLQVIVGAGDGSTKLNPPTSNDTFAPEELVASAVTTSGTVISGGRFAKIVSVAGPLTRVPLQSSATTVTAHAPGRSVTLSGTSAVTVLEDAVSAETSATPPSPYVKSTRVAT